MGKTTAERVSDWRQRLGLKARYFDEWNATRIAGLGFDPEDRRPEYLAIRRYMEAHPGARRKPLGVDFDEHRGCWVVTFDYGRCTPEEIALAAMAMRQATSQRVSLEGSGDGVSFQYEGHDVPELDRVGDEVAEMRRLGMWRA